jgi:hypothetical protein
VRVSNQAKPFIATIRPDDLADLLERIDKTRWPDQPHGSDWSGGAATVYVRDLLDGRRVRLVRLHRDAEHGAGEAPSVFDVR